MKKVKEENCNSQRRWKSRDSVKGGDGPLIIKASVGCESEAGLAVMVTTLVPAGAHLAGSWRATGYE